MNQYTFKRISKYVTKYKAPLVLSILCALFSVLANLAGPILIGSAIDYMLGPELVVFHKIIQILLALGLLYGLSSLLTWLLVFFTNTITYKVVNDIRNQLFEKINVLPLKFYDNHPHGDTISRFINDSDAIANGMQQSISTFITGIITIIGSIVFMLYINPVMTVIVLFSAPTAYFIARFINTKSKQMFRDQAKTVGKLNGYAEEIIGGQKIVKAFNYEERSFKEFASINRDLYNIGVKSQFYGSLAGPTTRLVNNFTYSVIGVIGSVFAISGRVSIGDISSFLIYANLFAKPFNEIAGIITQVQEAIASAQRIFEILDMEPEKSDDQGIVLDQLSEGNIQFEDVSFAYNSKKPLIQHFNLSIKKGTKIAIVGQTGAGKTTLVNLLMRFYDIDHGAISIDGIHINDIRRDSLRKQFGMVLQDTWLFSGTIRDNIAYGKEDATEEEIIRAAKAAEADSFIRRLPQKYDTLITDAGANLSHGQKQLLTIARVMLVDPPMLILDEATSSIDTRTEIYIQSAFKKMVAGRTSFIIAHRLSTIQESDLILVMDNGNIVESGNHQQLLQYDGYYAKLYNSQFQQV